MNSFEKMLAEFAEKTGVNPNGGGAGSFDVVADGVMVSAQYRPERDDCVIFSLPVCDMALDERLPKSSRRRFSPRPESPPKPRSTASSPVSRTRANPFLARR